MLTLSNSYFAIPAGGKLVLTIETAPDPTADSGVYYNEATVTPTQSYDDDAVTSGEAVSAADSGGQPYVRSSDQVVVTGGYSTTSQKWIQSIDNPDKIANSEMDNDDGVRYIVLNNEEENFRYTLEVANNLGSTMDKLLIVDVLPQSGDYAPFTVQGSTTARYSEFQVDLLDNLNLQVVLGTKKSDLDENEFYAADETIENQNTLTSGTDYTVYYSTCTSFGTGMKGNELLDLSAEDSSGNPIWTTDPTGARAIRIELSCSVPTNYVVQVSFNAKVSDADNLSNKNVAKPGEIAWNSFAYRYSTTDSSGGADPVTLWAAPRKVGIKIPESDGNYELPLTGGAGTLVHTTAGLLLSGGAACLMYKKKKRKGGCAS
ncbi:MAG: LPXTG cell wall anchor domain-containing protein [Lachnospiraceae bacterium]|nr:LPXTG cell wall anchor domain-containing protein [Lachnospiraceae bacterium]